MSSTLNLKKRKIINRKEVIVITVAIILTTAGIKASDNFFNPSNPAVKDESRCPSDMALVPLANGNFCIDKYEASSGLDCPHSNPSNQSETRINLDYSGCQPASCAGAIPWRNISQDQAVLACAKAGKRLPTNKEWFAAVLGTPDPEAGWGKDDCQVNNNWPLQPGLAGSGKNCVSFVGAYDLVGNVWEWVQGAVNDGYFAGKELPASGFIDSTDGESLPGITNLNTPNPDYNGDYFWIKNKGLRGIARGGYWNNKSEAGQYSVYMVLPPASVGAGIGFRCVK